jgi:hypothetical protein
MDDDDLNRVRDRLAAAGFDPPEEDLAALAHSYAQTRAMAALLFTVTEARYEEPALGFRVEPAHRDWF